MPADKANPTTTTPLTPRQCLLLYFQLGLAAILIQTVLIREFLVVFYGNELCLGMILGGWLLWIAAGAGLGGWSANRCVHPRVTVAWWMIVAAAVPFVQILAIRLVRVWLWVPAGQYLPIPKMLVAALVVLCPFSLVIGYTFPLALRLWAGGETKPEAKIGRVYLAEAAGSLLGGVLFTFVLVHLFPSMICAALCALLLLPPAACLLLSSSEAGVFRLGPAWLCLLACLAVCAGGLLLNERSIVARWQSVGLQEESKPKEMSLAQRVRKTAALVVEALRGESTISSSAVGNFVRSVDSPYQNIVLSEAHAQYNVFFNGHYAFCFPDVETYSLTAVPVLAQHPNPKRVLLIDNGNLELAEAMLRDCVERLDYVQLDPEALRALLPELQSPALTDPRLQIHHTDGRRFVRSTSQRYDLIFVHLGDPSTASTNRYYTLEFFREVRSRLRPGGVFAFALSSTETYFGDAMGDYSATIFHTLKQVFEPVLVDSGTTATYFGALENGVLTGDQRVLFDRASRWLKPGEFPPPEIIYSLFFPERSHFVYEELSRRTPDRLNSDALPAAYLDYLLLWDRQVGSKFHVLLGRLKSMPRALLLGLLVLMPLAWLGLTIPLRRGEHRPVPTYLLAVSVTGFSAMGLEVVLLLAFQTALGYLYQWVGLVVATFMLGLAIGAHWVTGRMSRWQDKRPPLMAVHAALVALAFVVPLVLPTLSSTRLSSLGPLIPLAFILLMAAAGLFTGAQLPLAAAQTIAADVEPVRAAGLIDRADHFGAFLGAVLCGALLLPVAGITATCWLVCALNLSVIALLAAWRRARPAVAG